MSQFIFLIKRLSTLLLLLILCGCVSANDTKPNPNYSGPYPDSFISLKNKNSLLAEEIAKLPELQDGLDNTDLIALDQIAQIYNLSEDLFDKVFYKMLQTGKPEVRKYCSPLQALFWLAEGEKKDLIFPILKNYSLTKLLDASWEFHQTFILEDLNITEQQAEEIVASINKDVIWYAKHQKTTKDALKLYYYCNPNNPKEISSKYRDIIETDRYFVMAKAKYDKNIKRWTEFDTVVYRLNAPELLHYFINKNVIYKKNRTNSHTSQHTFKYKWGDCDDLSKFGQFILRKAGYYVLQRYVLWKPDRRGHVGLVIKESNSGYFLAVDFGGTSQNIMSGPYRNISDVNKRLANGNSYYESGWR
jgi:hypothetical protein